MKTLKTLAKHSWLAWSLLICGLFVTTLMSIQVKRGLEAAAMRQFAFDCDQVTLKIHERLSAYALILRGAAGLFAASDDVSRQEWHDYVEMLNPARTVSGIQGIGFAQRIAPNQLADHIASIRAEGFSNYHLYPTGERESYSAIIYLEPFRDRNLRAFGYDMFSEPVRRAAMEQARDSGRSALTGKVLLVQETQTDVQTGTLMYFPVYRNKVPIDTVEQRRAALLGWIYSPYRMNDLMSGILGDWAHQQGQFVQFHLYDGSQARPEALLFRNHEFMQIHPSASLQVQRTIDFHGTKWLLTFDQISAIHGMKNVWITAIAGTVLSSLLFGLTLSLLRTRASIRLERELTEKLWRRERALKESEFRWRFALEGAGDGLMDWSLEEDRVFYSRRWKTLLGFARSDIGDQLNEWTSRVHPDDLGKVWATLLAYFDSEIRHYVSEYRMICKDGSWKCFLARGMVVNRNATGQPLRMIVTHTDITDRRRTTEQLQLAASVFVHAREGIMITDANGTILDVNAAFTYITGYHHDEVIGRNPRLLKSNRHDAEFYTAMWRSLIDEGQWIGETWNRRKNGEVYAQMQTISAVRNAQGTTQHYVSLMSDITSMKEHQRQLEYIAHYDALTSLPNRLLLAYRLDQAMTQTKRRQQSLAVVYLDLDGFKAINDNHGHDAGDQLLMTVATRMKQNLRDCDTLARLGGDEFVAVLVDLEHSACCVPMLTRLLRAAAQPVHFDDLVLQVSASIGVTFYPQFDDVNADQLLRQADQAMYQAKLSGKNRYQCFDARQPSLTNHNENHIERIRLALHQGELALRYQPQVNMRTGAIIGLSAQLGWQHSERGWLPASTFMPLLDNQSLAIDINIWVINTLLTQLDIWQRQQLSIQVKINFGINTLQQQQLIPHLQTQLLAHSHLSPNLLRLEITEAQALTNLTHTAILIDACRALGVGCTLDDFGAGYTALVYLKRLAVPLLKINLLHVPNVLDEPEDLAILNSMIGLAAAFHREIIINGVESQEQGNLLLQLGCPLAQGNGIAPAMNAEALAHWMQHWHAPLAWLHQQALNRDALPLLFASVGHRAWMRAIDESAQQHTNTRLPMHVQECHFGQWLESDGVTCYGHLPNFQALVKIHHELHALAQQLLQDAQNVEHREENILSQRMQLHQLQKRLLTHIEELLKKSRQTAGLEKKARSF
ncbi:bifunctional diguanylate cyclase/phosphodiesterase [Chromatium weissei]|nr:bifunctional diguanylate cyclase/phosphodiesterase [Chromatium weissei]